MPFETALAKLEFDRILQRLLHHAASEPGAEFLRALRPCSLAGVLRDELALVSEMKHLRDAAEAVPLSGIMPVRTALTRCAIEGTVLQPGDLVQIASTLAASRVVRAFAARHAADTPGIAAVSAPLLTDKVLEYNLTQAIDESGSIRDTASRTLRDVRRSIRERSDRLRKRLEAILRNVSEKGLSQEEIITTRDGRMVIPVKSEHRGRVPGFVHSASSSGATIFVEPTETLELNNEIRDLEFAEHREIERILRELTAQVAERRDALLASLAILARIDAIHAKAAYATEIGGVEPLLGAGGPVVLTGARHPILLLTHGRGGTVPLDVTIGGDYHTLVISGPNAGGKSVAMKCVGLLVLMAHCGLHIPAMEGAVVRIVDDIFVDIGDDQSIENDLSTFSSHLASLREIARHAGPHSLVLIDEIGSGTDPAEGGAIAAALLEALTLRKTLTIATTHQGLLKAFAHETPGIENAAMEFDVATLTPTYRLRTGVPGNSYAIEMARRMGLDAALIDRARAMMGSRQSRLESLLTELEAGSQEQRKVLDDTAAERHRLAELTAAYEEKIAIQAKEVREIRRKALEEAKDIVSGANATIERTIRDLREHQADTPTIRRSREEIAQFREKIEATYEEVLPDPPAAPPGSIRVGGSVRMADGGQTGEVMALTPDGEHAVVLFGTVRMKIPLANLVPGASQPSRPTASGVQLEKPERVQRDLDLRGLTGDEALPLIDKFIDDALLSGLSRIDIIHGKGTGALRRKVTEFLAHHPRVRAHRLGEWNEGGTGATIVELGDA